MKEPIDFEQLIGNKIYEREPQDRDRTQDPDKKFSPSSAGYCERQMFLTKAGLKVFTRKAVGSMKSGSILHKWIGGSLRDKGALEQNVKLVITDQNINPENLYFEGTYDFFDYTYIYDFKSTSNINYSISSPTEKDKDQLIIYMAGLSILKGFIVYIDKRHLKVKQHLVEFNQKRLEKIFQRATNVYREYINWKYNGKKEIPFKKCGCNFCDMEDEHE